MSSNDLVFQLNELIGEADSIKSDIEAELAKDQQQDEAIKIEEKKIEFQNYIQNKVDKINIRSQIIRFKYSSYKRYFDCVNVGIIVSSATLTFIETLKAKYDLEDNGTAGWNGFFSAVPIIISTGITISAAILKFKKYQEKMETMSRCVEKAIFTIFRLKRLQEQVRLATTLDEIKKIYEIYSGEPHDLYLKCQEEMEKNLKYEDLVRHMKTFYHLSLVYEQEESDYRLNRMSIGLNQDLRSHDLENQVRESILRKSLCQRLCCCFDLTPSPVLDMTNRSSTEMMDMIFEETKS